jgi:hypothetical protein
VPVIGAGNHVLYPGHDAGGCVLDENHYQRRA